MLKKRKKVLLVYLVNNTLLWSYKHYISSVGTLIYLFTISHVETTRGNNYKLHHEKFCLKIKQSIEQPPKSFGGVSITGYVQDAVGQGVR